MQTTKTSMARTSIARTSVAGTSMVVAALLAGGIAASMGYSFEASQRSIFRNPTPGQGAVAPVQVNPLAVQPITDGTDAASRARSWFDPATGKICLGTEINKTCR